MGVFLKRHIDENILIGVWEITEPVDFFLSNLTLNEKEQKLFNNMKHDLRRTHWLSYRLLIKEIFESPDIETEIHYDNNGKPFFTTLKHHLSISHSGIFSACILSQKKKVGIDVEKISAKLLKIEHKFLGENEIIFTEGIHKIELLTILWGAKEALYKSYGKGELSFIDNLKLEEFDYCEKGETKGFVIVDDEVFEHQVFFEKIDDYFLVYSIEI
ncbi:MAG: 4'-phosphopantetheinyl transferase superfamily protein [Bacteroidetes bacterium]|nr:4'-phosphopantetheinyl transferase superfamily protein [Bacteroidota bacterium]